MAKIFNFSNKLKMSHLKGKLYKLKKGVEPELIIVTPYISEKALEKAERFNITVYSDTELESEEI